MQRGRWLLAVWFVLVVSLLAAPWPVTPVRAASASALGVNSHIASTYPNLEQIGVAYDALGASQAGWAREEFQWGRIEPFRGQFDWNFFDQTVDALTARGVNILGLLNPAVPWGTPSTADDGQDPRAGTFYPPDPQLFAEFAGRVVSRYKDRVRYWQVWNEPDNGIYWRPAPDPAAYAALLKAVYPAIKAADPNAIVLAAGVVSPEPAGSFYQTLYDNGAWNSFDVLALHPYTDPAGPEDGAIGSVGIGAIQTLATRLGPKPIWVTEFGWSDSPTDRTGNQTVDVETQANYLMRAFALMRAAGAEKVIMFRFKDMQLQNGRVFNGYGLYRYGSGTGDYSQPKPALAAFRTMSELVGPRQVTSLLSLNPQEVVVSFDPFGSWRSFPPNAGSLEPSGGLGYRGAGAALRYNFPTGGNDYVAITPNSVVNIPADASRLGLWVFGDGSGFDLKVQLRDSQGELLQFRLGKVGPQQWQFLDASIRGFVEPGNRLSGGNGQLDGAIRLEAIVLDDDPDARTGQGTVFIDELTAIRGAETFGVRFVGDGNQVIDMLWAPNETPARLPSSSGQAAIVDRDGGRSTRNANNGGFDLNLGPRPIYVIHTPASTTAPPPVAPTTTPTTAPVVPTTTPTTAPAPPAAGPCRTFPETGFTVCGRLLSYWNENGGLAVFGYPIGPQKEVNADGKIVQAQEFERNRLELHPTNARPYDVLLGRLGVMRLERLGRAWENLPKVGGPPSAGCLFFAETGHSLCEPFLSYYRRNGLEFDGRRGFSDAESLALFGYPISEPATETNSSGDTVLTQWFERARFEYHPTNPDPFKVLLGLLGNETR